MDQPRADLVGVFVCPRCKGGLTSDAQGLSCDVCKLLYPFDNGIPVLIVEEASPFRAGSGAQSGSP